MFALDTRGHGRSPRGSAPFTIRQFSRDVYDFMAARRIPAAILLGFSDGANIAMQFALEHPGMVRALILNGGNLDPAGVKRSVQLPIEIGYRIARRFAARSADAGKHAELLGLMVNEPHIQPRELSQIAAPTLVICGRKNMIREAHTREIAANLPHARLTILPGNHFIANRHPAEFNRAVDEFLEAVR